MPVLNPTVAVDVQRPRYSLLTGATNPPTIFLPQQPARMEKPPATLYLHIPSSLTEVELWLFVFDSGLDIVEGDFFSKITRLDGVTLWPPDTPQPGIPGAGLIQWLVRYHEEQPPIPAPCRFVLVERKRLGGPLHITP